MTDITVSTTMEAIEYLIDSGKTEEEAVRDILGSSSRKEDSMTQPESWEEDKSDLEYWMDSQADNFTNEHIGG